MRAMSKRTRWPAAALAVVLVLSGCSFMNWFDVDDAIAATNGLPYPIVDTNQSLTYNNSSVIAAPGTGAAFHGQDAQYDGNQMNYFDNGDGTVTDLVTGLMWQQGYSGKMSQGQAVAGASSFNLAGYTDWRLPTIKELYSLIDFSGEDVDPMSSSANNPFIDTSCFDFAYGDTSAGERVIDSQWATSTLYVAGDLMFGVNFADGRIKGYGLTSPRGGEMQFYVRYVRGNTAYGENEFISNGDGNSASAVAGAESGETTIPLGTGGTVTDLATGLMWSQDDSGAFSDDGSGMDWEAALAYVQELNEANYLGYSDWRLPNAKELQSIVDYTRSPDTTNSAAIDPVFNVTSITNEAGEKDWGFYWTSTTHASARGGQAAVYIALGRGLGYMNGRYVDVHGAGCQRSDPKSGSPIPTGRGPQGDVVRVTNLVRVTRSIEGVVVATPSMVGDVTVAEDTAVTVTDNEDEAYVLFSPLGGEKAYLISLDGNVVHDWEISGQPGNSVYLAEGGNLLATYTVEGHFQQGGVGGGIELLTWDGDEVWSFELATDRAHLHHDVEMLPNGNVLMISWEAKTRQEAIAAGLRSQQLPDSGEVWSEMILEYSPTLDQVVWEWHLWDHALPAGLSASQHPEKIDLAYFSNRQSSDWWHFNSVDYSAELDQIVISSRAASEIWIIDHNLTTAQAEGALGDLLYRFGNPAAYGGSGSQELVHQHDAGWIEASLDSASSSYGTASGSGVRVLVFDNGDKRTRPYSRVLELQLPSYENGLFEDAEIVWSYGAASGSEHFFADHISGAQRLESGNTLICSGTEGRFFEVTPDGETVWEYVNPFTSTGPDGKEGNEVFRADAYSAEFIGQDLGNSAESVASSAPIGGAQNIASGELPGAAGPPGITAISPESVIAGSGEQLVTITLSQQYAPPTQVQFTRVAIGNVEATRWTRIGLTVRAWFDIPSQMPPGEYALTIAFTGRESEPIAFSYGIAIE